MGYYENAIHATKLEDYLDHNEFDVLFNEIDLFNTLKDIAQRVVALEAEVKWLRNPVIG